DLSLTVDTIINSILSLRFFKEYINNKDDILTIMKMNIYVYSAYFGTYELDLPVKDIDKFNSIIKDRIFLYKDNICHVMTVINYYIDKHNSNDLFYNVELKGATIKFLLKLIVNANDGIYSLSEVIETILFYITNDVIFKHNVEILKLLNVCM